MSLENIAMEENTLKTLKALRNRVAQSIDSTTSARDVASLSRQLTQILHDIAEIEGNVPAPKMEVTLFDAVSAERAAAKQAAED